MSDSIFMGSDEELRAMRILDDAGVSDDVKERIRVLMRHLHAKAISAEYVMDMHMLERSASLLSGTKSLDSLADPNIVVKDEFWDFFNCIARNDMGPFGPTATFDLASYEARPGKQATSTPCDPDELVKRVKCTKCGFQEAELTYYSALDGGTINKHKRLHCVKCEYVTDTRDY